MKKLCIFCKYFDLDMGEPAYSEVTPGSNAEISCTKGHWRMGNYGETSDFKKAIQEAETCKDFKLDWEESK